MTQDSRIEIVQRWLQRLQPLTVVPVQIAARPPRAYEAVLFDHLWHDADFTGDDCRGAGQCDCRHLCRCLS